MEGLCIRAQASSARRNVAKATEVAMDFAVVSTICLAESICCLVMERLSCWKVWASTFLSSDKGWHIVPKEMPICTHGSLVVSNTHGERCWWIKPSSRWVNLSTVFIWWHEGLSMSRSGLWGFDKNRVWSCLFLKKELQDHGLCGGYRFV